MFATNTGKLLTILLIVVVVLSTLALTTSASAQQNKPPAVGLRPDAPPYAVHGPYWVGTREFVIPDKMGNRPLPLTVWYPALNPDGAAEQVTYSIEYPPVLPKEPISGHALQDAKLDTQHGPYPLVIFSHGAFTWRYASLYFIEHLVSYGFVVMSADHVGDTAANLNDEGAFVRAHVNRPRDISREIDYAATLTATGGGLDGMIDLQHVVVSGHSSGGWTTLLAAGARRDYSALNAWCAQYPKDQWTCGMLKGQEKTLAGLLGLNAVPTGLWPSVGDPRVTALILFEPGSIPAFGQDGLASVTVPTMMFASSGDTLLPFDIYAKPAYDDLGSQVKGMAVFEQGDHNLFANSCDCAPWLRNPDLFGLCSDSVWDMDRAHDLVNHLATVFLLDILKGDKDAHKALLPDAVKFVGLDYKTTLK
jgi:predicted dienelactone hydrolase